MFLGQRTGVGKSVRFKRDYPIGLTDVVKLCISRKLCNEHFVGSKALTAFQAIHHRIAKPTHMSAGFPYLRIHDDRAVHAHHLNLLPVWSERRAADHIVPPSGFDVVLEFDSERAVVPEAVDSAVDLARSKDESLAPAQRDQFFHVHDLAFSSSLTPRASTSSLTLRV